MKHAVVIDAGSSGSRAFVYTWPDPVSYVGGLAEDSVLKEALIPIETMPLWTTKHQPGVSTFAGNTGRIWKDHLEPLLQKALEVIPQTKHHETPVFFLATAGMRLLNSDDQQEILSTVCHLLQSKTNFLVPECESHVTVIDGEVEALYGWLGLNYLVHWSLTEKWNDFASTYGFLDMGGASSQLAFAVDKQSEAATKHADDLLKLRIRTAGGQAVEWEMFVETWLGFGANQARHRYLSQLVAEVKDSVAEYERDNVPVPCLDPCMPYGAVHNVEVDGHNYIFQGSGDFATCERRAYGLLNAGAECPEEPCLFDGKHAPGFDVVNQKFVGVSEYWYTLEDLLGSNGKYDLATVESRLSSLCSSDWSTVLQRINSKDIVKSNGQLFSEEDAKATCFKSAWVLTTLTQGFNFSLDPEDPHTDHKFQDTFQSAMEIEGAEISWTTGRAVLYASSQIPSTGENVGFYNPQREFIPGGELLSLDEIQRFQASRSGWGTTSVIFIWAIVILALVLGTARLVMGSFAEVWESFAEIRIVKRIRRKLRHWNSARVYSTTNMGYGYSFPHADYPLTDVYSSEGISSSRSSRSSGRTPSRIGSRASLVD